MRLVIYGAGMAGLLAANMLRRFQPLVREAQHQLPNNHRALLRFRTSAVSDASGIHFRRVRVQKALRWKGVVSHVPTIQQNNMYAQKVTGSVLERSMISMEAVDRYVAPSNFIPLLEVPLTIEYNTPLTMARITAHKEQGDIILSTIPMPTLMDMVDWPAPRFRWKPIWTVRAHITDPVTQVYQTIYYPELTVPFYRASITGDLVTVESMQEPAINQLHNIVQDVLHDFGISGAVLEDVVMAHQKFGKLLPTDEGARRAFILAMTDQHNLYSVGRFATWRQILLDDVVHDLQVVDRFITDRDDYARHLLSKGKA